MALPNPNPSGGGAAVIQFPGNFVSQENKYKKEHLELLNDGFDSIRDSLNVLSKNIADLIFFLKGKFAEQADLKTQERDVKDVAGSVAGKDDLFGNLKDLNIGFGDILLGAIAAYALGIDKYIRTVFLSKTIAQFAKIPEAVSDYFKTLRKAFKAGMQGLPNLMKTIKPLKELGKIGTFAFTLGKYLKPIINFFSGLTSVFKIFGQLTGITGTISKIASMFAKIMPILKGIGSKLLLPLFAIFDFVSGFIEGFASKGEGDTRSTMERLLDGLAGGFIKMIKGIFIVPLDLLKDGVEWIARQMGFEKFADALGSFSFDETFDKLIKFGKNLFSLEPEEGYFSIVKFMADKVQGVKDWFDTLMTDPVKALEELASGYLDIITSPAKFIWDKLIKPAIEGIMKMFGKEVELPSSGGVGDMINNFFKKILRAILPTPNDNAKWYDIPNLISKAIPNDVYKFAGLDPKTGEIVIDDTAKVEAFKASTKEPGLKPEGAATGELSKDVAAKKEGGGGTTVVDQSQKSGDVVTQNSSTSVAQDKPNARKSNPASGRI